MAAGFGKRMQPLTFTTPKPLISVNGTPMIESVINALHQNHIFEIYIVVGYLKSQYEYLLSKYTNVHLVDNPYYDQCNNISSLYVAREHLDNVIILDGDQLINEPQVLKPTFGRSGYNCVWTDTPTDEWLLSVDSDNIVTGCSRNGGSRGWRLYSVSRWNHHDCQLLKQCLEKEFQENQNRQLYWDDVAMFSFPNKFKLTIYPMKKNDVIEIDNIEQLSAIDGHYQRFLN